MGDLLSVFESDEPDPTARSPLMMTTPQREEIRSLFAELGIGTAGAQFEITAELTGVRISSVGELQAATAQRLIEGLRRRVAARGRTLTGNSWSDREQDTWIDRL